MHRKFGLLSPGKASSHSMALLCSFLFFFLCAVFSCFYTTDCEANSFMTDGCGMFNMRTHLGACRTQEGGSGTKKSAQELILRGQKICPARGLNPGSLDLKSDSIYLCLTTELQSSPPLLSPWYDLHGWLGVKQQLSIYPPLLPPPSMYQPMSRADGSWQTSGLLSLCKTCGLVTPRMKKISLCNGHCYCASIVHAASWPFLLLERKCYLRLIFLSLFYYTSLNSKKKKNTHWGKFRLAKQPSSANWVENQSFDL